MFFPVLLLLASLTICMALSPLLYGGSSSRQSYILGGNQIRQHTKHSKSSTLFYMVEGPPEQQPQQTTTTPQKQQQQLWAEYISPDLDIPTTTEIDVVYPGHIPPRPKIVVFGASGRIGRRIVKKLLSSGVNMDVVAFVRDRQKFEDVLYDEEDMILDNLLTGNDDGSRNNGPRLHVVISDVVSRRDLYQRTFETDSEKKVLDDWVSKAKVYFIRKGWTYNNSTSLNSFEDDDKIANDVDILESGGEEALRDAISGATIIISCLASFRPSKIWTDYLKVPLARVFRKDVSQWCSDATHPYYVHYLTTKKILNEAEKEQRKRDILVQFENEKLLLEEELRRGREMRDRARGKEEEGFESEIAEGLRKKRNTDSFGQEQGNTNDAHKAVSLPKSGQLPSTRDRIKFIRISNLMVGHSPFRPMNVLTNMFWSLVSRYEYMGEALMESSKLVDTIVLRPGDLTDEERNVNHTSLQLCIDGKVESPSLVGREDVADLAVVAALTKSSRNATDTGSSAAHHYQWALRWTGQHISPPQGLRPDGLSTAALCYVKAVKEQTKKDGKKRLKEKRLESYHGGRELMRLKRFRRRLKPYLQSFAISVPVYSAIGLMSWYLFGQAFIELFGRLKRFNMPQLLLKLLP